MKILHDNYTMSNGITIPKIGFGTWQIPDGDETYRAVTLAIKNGYRHIDTAQIYGNEASVGKAITHSPIRRKDIFITSKLHGAIKTYDEAIQAFDESLDKLGTDYLDLFLIHAPKPPGADKTSNYDKENVEVYKALEKLYKEGRIRSIGVSNFTISDLKNIITHCDVVPHVNQIAYFIGLDNDRLHAYCDEKKILIEAYSPLAIGHALKNETIVRTAEKYNVTPAQICLKYLLQRGTLPLPKSVNEERIRQNKTLQFTIEKSDMDRLKALRNDPR